MRMSSTTAATSILCTLLVIDDIDWFRLVVRRITKIKNNIECVVIAAARADVCCADDSGTLTTVAEDVVHTSVACAAEDLVHMFAQGLDPRRVMLRVEVADKDDKIADMSVLSDHPQDVVSGRRTSTITAGTYGEWAMMIDEECGCIVVLSLQTSPLCSPATIVLLAGVFPNVFPT